MAKIQFLRAVRIAPRKGKPQVYAAGSIHEITDHDILKHPHFLAFKKGGALQEYKAPAAPKVLSKGPMVALKNPSARDGRVAPGVLPGNGGKLLAEAKAKEKQVATAVKPETEIGGEETVEEVLEEATELAEGSESVGDEEDSDKKNKKGSKKGSK